MSVKQIEALLRDKIGLRADSIGVGAVEQAMRVRALACHVAGPEAYAEHVRRHPEELDRLVEEIVVSETWFFREAAAFELLRQRFVARPHDSAPFRVLSLPCATGEEPYSIAMTLLEVAGLAQFEVHAVDVSANALELAERAVYGKLSFRSEQPGYAHYFESVAGGTRVCAAVRARVRFARGNVLDPLLCAGTTFDAVFCRNLLIYLDTEARNTALRNLQRLMRDDGLLFAGHAEASGIIAAGFRKVGDPRSFAFTKPGAGNAAAISTVTLPAVRVAPVRASTPEARVRKPAVAVHTPQPRIAPTPVLDLLAEARALADRGDLDAARSACDAQLLAAGPNAEGFCLLGVVKKAAGDFSGALESFGKALYLDSACYEALAHSALIHEHAGRADEARKLRARAARAEAARDDAGRTGRANRKGGS